MGRIRHQAKDFYESILDNTVVVSAENQSTSEKANAVQEAINEADDDGKDYVLVTRAFIGYDASQVTFHDTVQMVREGNIQDVYDVQAYGAFADGPSGTDDQPAIDACASAADTAGYDRVFHPPGTYTVGTDPTFPGSTRPVGQAASYDGSSVAISATGWDRHSDDSVSLPAQDLSNLSLGASEDGRIYRHDGQSSISADGGTTSDPGYYAWDNDNSEFTAGFTVA